VISGQIRQVIEMVDYYLVENIRTARRFISSLKVKDVSSLEFQVFNKDTTEIQLSQLLNPVMEGIQVGIISEAGCPAVADPGSRVVRWAHSQGIRVVPLAGPSSIILALMGSGMNGQHFEFHGYLPIDTHKRIKKIQNLERESSKTGKCQIFMEAPYRNSAMVQAIIDHSRGDTSICFATDITSDNETICTKTVSQWKQKLPETHKKPTIFLLQAKSSSFK
jgi:16S rRNA (cytidine1402-2'-O)-methyltransferase